jgi:hypothetical protein
MAGNSRVSDKTCAKLELSRVRTIYKTAPATLRRSRFVQ